MRTLFQLRLRTALPVFLGVAAVLGSLLIIGLRQSWRTKYARQINADNMRLQSSILRNNLSELLAAGQSAMAERRFLDTMLDYRLQSMVVVDETDRIRLATRRECLGQMGVSAGGFDEGVARQAVDGLRDRFDPVGDSGFVGYFPMELNLQAGTLRNHHRGVLCVRYDISAALAQTRRRLNEEIALITGFWLLLAFTLYIVLNVLVTRKVDRMLRVMDEVKGGRRDARVRLSGGSELARLGQSFDLLLDRIGESERDLRDSREFFDAIIESLPAMVFVKEAKELRFVRFNKAGEELLGFRREDLIGKNDFDFFPPEQAEAFTRKDRVVLEGWAPVDIPEEVIRTNRKGDRLLHTTKVTIPDANGRPAYLLGFSQDITEQKRAEQALRESEASFERMVMVSPIPIGISNAKGEIEFLNHSFVNLFGYTREDLPNLDAWWPRAYPDSDYRAMARRYWFEAAERAKTTGKDFKLDQVHAITCKDGSRCYVEISAALLSGRHLVNFNDITDRVMAEKALKASEARLKTITEQVPATILQLDANGRILYVNHTPPGMEMDKVIGRDWLELISPEHRETARQALDKALQTGTLQDYEIQGQGQNGETRWFSSRLGPIADRAGLASAILFTSDVTERKALERKVAQAQRLESLGSLAGGVAHDMNNVLGAILALATTHADQAAAGSTLRKSMETITRACQRGGAMVKGLLGFARQELAEEQVVDLNRVVREEVALLERTTLQKVQLEADLEEGLLPVKGDLAALSHAVMNLCVNSVDAMPEGGELTLRTRNEGRDHVTLAVADNGCGMSKDVQEKALDPFFTTKTSGKGTGLGLSMVYGTVKAHGGQLEIQSDAGRGTTVLIRLPACREREAEAPKAEEPAGRDRSLQVLVVDDDDLIQASTGRLLKVLGHRPTVVGRGEEALRLLEEGQPFDIVILDMNMPGLGGAGTLPRLRRLRPSLPVLLATGRVDQTALDLIHSFEGVVLLAKPFTLNEVRVQMSALT